MENIIIELIQKNKETTLKEIYDFLKIDLKNKITTAKVRTKINNLVKTNKIKRKQRGIYYI